MAQIGPKMLKKQFCEFGRIQMVQIAWRKGKPDVGAYNLTCFYPWQGSGAPRMGPGAPKIDQKWLKKAQKAVL